MHKRNNTRPNLIVGQGIRAGVDYGKTGIEIQAFHGG
jgi:hypothetical protein